MTRTLRVALGVTTIAALAACHNSAPANDGTIRAEAHMLDSAGKEVGIVRLSEAPGAPGATVSISVSRGATPGQHGLHFHSVGNCAPAGKFSAAGGHFNPEGKKHGLMSPDGPHAGDFETMTIDDFGHVTFLAEDRRVTLSPGPRSLLDADGSSVVLHALPDDQRTDPSGNSGDRIACGVIVRR